MPGLSERDRTAIAQLFAQATQPVEVVVATPGGPSPSGFRSALAEVAGFVPCLQVTDLPLQDHGAFERLPAIALRRPDGDDLRIRFYGLPSGHEFASFLQAVADAATQESALSPATLTALAGLTSDIQIKVFSTPTCPHCPRAVRLAGLMSLASPHVSTEAIDAAFFGALAGLYQVRGVPRIVFNRKVHVEGAVPEAVFLERLLAAA